MKYLTVDEVAMLLRVKRQTIYKWITERRISSISVGGRTLFDADVVEECLRAGKRPALRR